jgi:beta-aspartyl-peptidase (threonine type)
MVSMSVVGSMACSSPRGVDVAGPGDAASASEPEPRAAGGEARWGLVIHGGAGTIDPAKLTPELEADYRDTLGRALDAGYVVLERGGTSLDAVTAAVVVMEDSPLFNAGRGAVFTHEGTNEMDASIMDGATGAAGAVAGVATIRNPVRAARAVMEASPHVLLIGRGAEAFAELQGLALEPADYFRTEQRWQELERVRGSERTELDHGSDGHAAAAPGADKYGTVGAVAVDRHGNLAAATSTGGMTNKRWGRVGDSPLIGAGTFARNATCAVSATGHGEYFIREAAAHAVSARMEYGGASLGEAARAVVFDQLAPRGGMGGVIAIDRGGRIAMPFSTPGMYRGARLSDGTRQVLIWDR